MVKLGLFIKADLDGVTDLAPVDSPQDPYFFTFKVVCNSCHEVNDSWVTISRQEKVALSGSRGEANFVWKCKNCRVNCSNNSAYSREKVPQVCKLRDQVADCKDIESQVFAYSSRTSGLPAKVIEFDCRGCEFTEFRPDGSFACRGGESGTKFEDVDLSELSWYDYDENVAKEVSVTNVEFSIQRA